jgi:aryl carrier-like protein
VWREILGLSDVGIDDNFFELGGDSLTALRFTALYQERRHVSLPVTALYAAPTIRRLLAATASSCDVETRDARKR